MLILSLAVLKSAPGTGLFAVSILAAIRAGFGLASGKVGNESWLILAVVDEFNGVGRFNGIFNCSCSCEVKVDADVAKTVGSTTFSGALTGGGKKLKVIRI